MRTTPFVYLAHPIDFVSGATSGEATRLLRNAGLGVYDPAAAFRLPDEATPNGTINEINRAALSACGGLLAFLPGNAQTYGVPMEIEQARAEGKPILLITPDSVIARSWALQLAGPDFATRSSLKEQDANWLRDRVVHGGRRNQHPAPSRAMYVQADPGAPLPTRAYSGDAGFDLYTTEETAIEPGEFVDVPVGLRVQLPEGVWGMITGRSSTVRKLDLLVTVGIIDGGYRGRLYAGVRSMRPDVYVVKVGERIAQLIPFPNVAQTLHPVAVDVLAPSDRGEAGFGSSGA